MASAVKNTNTDAATRLRASDMAPSANAMSVAIGTMPDGWKYIPQ